MGHKTTHLSAHSDRSKSPVTALSLPLQLSSGGSPGWLPGLKVAIRTRCPFFTHHTSGWGRSDLQGVARISHPTCTGRPASSPSSPAAPPPPPPPPPPPVTAERYATRCRLPGRELFKCATSLMSVSYSPGWTLIKNYEQLLGQWGGIVIREPAFHAGSSESNHVWQRDPFGCRSVADWALWCLNGRKGTNGDIFLLL